MLQLCQLNLQLTLVTFCAQRKNIQNQRNAIDHTQIKLALEVTLLRGRQRLVKQNDFGVKLLCK